MKHSAQFRQCLIDCDVAGVRMLWKHISPNLPQPSSDADALRMIHHARTQAQSIPLRLRAYSHRWLSERNFPSGLPDNLKARAERMYPTVADSVGISVKGVSEVSRLIAPIVRGAMSDAVLDAYASGRKEPEFVRERMQEARKKTIKELLS